MGGRSAVVLAAVLSVLTAVVEGQTPAVGEPNVPTLFVVGDSTAIVCSPIPRNNWTEGAVGRASQSYGRWAAEAAQAEGAAFIDLNELIARCYEQTGCERVTGICFPPGERTHTSAAGAQINAACVVEGLEVLDDCPLVQYLLNTRL
ncbi:MAG: hypothetical protein ABFD90_04640 [Phycisphaerales bacterium]